MSTCEVCTKDNKHIPAFFSPFSALFPEGVHERPCEQADWIRNHQTSQGGAGSLQVSSNNILLVQLYVPQSKHR